VTPRCCKSLCSSMNVGLAAFSTEDTFAALALCSALLMPTCRFMPVQVQQGPFETGTATIAHVVMAGLHAEGSSQAAFSHCSSHLGLAQLVGLAHLLLQDNSSQTGEHLGSGAAQVVWHWAGWHTDSHFGHPCFSH